MEDESPTTVGACRLFLCLAVVVVTVIQGHESSSSSSSSSSPFDVQVLQAAAAHTSHNNDARRSAWPVVVSSAIQDGVKLGKTALDVARWPLDQATSLVTSHLAVTSSLIALFNLAVDLFVRPGGTGAILAAWLTANDTHGGRQLISASAAAGASMASDLLTAARWPLDVGLSLLGAFLMVHTVLMALFDTTVRPDGAGQTLLSWLRGSGATT